MEVHPVCVRRADNHPADTSRHKQTIIQYKLNITQQKQAELSSNIQADYHPAHTSRVKQTITRQTQADSSRISPGRH
ncbi:hypothetical protein Hamer_G025961 [Homarus americanus]|uniref:Uncharacterized protein n=1 Tax=Homarus americanus TaxID=6706 RepID=A0A8J5ML11_HOMAM|nr:hypothetical protein Hamer_G025961 [Homarus americanus]